ncbi:MAG: calcium/sodium antiporter [Erysipelotrichaceae bacterium]|nr:calcium/sodium antiporter [Erysipelotrichaceae bacterium]
MEILYLLLGFVLLIKGADYFVDGASSISSVLKVPTIIVGLTVVSFGTSAPEAAVSIFASITSSNDIAVSNVVGSNIFNLLVVLGVSACMADIVIPKSIVKFDFPLVIVFSVMLYGILFFDHTIGRFESLVFLMLLMMYVAYLVYDSLKKREALTVEKPKFGFAQSIVFMIIGLVGIIAGGDFVVKAAKEIALGLGFSEKLVGLTIVSIGTSLPELVTSMVAAKKGEVDIAVGNVVGSNIFNLLFILGLSGVISPMSIDPAIMFDVIFMIGITVMTFVICKYQDKLKRRHGFLMLMVFVGYLIYIVGRR